MLSHFQRAHKNQVRCRAAACVDSFESVEDMLSHYSKCHRLLKGFPCFNSRCTKIFKTLPEATRHSKEPHLSCAVRECREVFPSRQEMVTHMFGRHSACGVCKEKGGARWVFGDRWECEEHFRESSHLYCWLCAEMFLERETFQKHHEEKHRDGRKETVEEVE